MQQSRVRLEDQLGNAEADTAADLGRRHQSEILIDAWGRLLYVRSHWYPIMLLLHRFIIAVSRVGKGGSAPDPLVWDQGHVIWLRPGFDERPSKRARYRLLGDWHRAMLPTVEQKNSTIKWRS